MVTEYWHNQTTSRKAMTVSLVIHLLGLLLLFILRDERPIQMLFQVKFVPVQERIPEKDRVEIQKEIKKIEKRKKKWVKKKSNTSKSTTSNTNKTSRPVTREEQFMQDYEQTLFTRKKTANNSVPVGKNKSKKYAWNKGREKTGPGKKTTRENVKIPGGRISKGRIRWQGRTRSLINWARPAYPRYYRERAIQGTVLLSFSVNASGRVSSVTVIRSSGYPKLDLLAKNSLRRARFTPSGGNQVDRGQWPITFRLR